MSHEFQDQDREAIDLSVKTALTMWEGRKVAILLPCYRGVLNVKTHMTLFACYASYGPTRIALPEPIEGTVIHEARNILIHKALQMQEVEEFIMLDDDMVLPVGNEGYFNGNLKAGVSAESARFNGISRIMSHGKDKEIVGALYFGRHEFGRAQCEWGFRDKNLSRRLRQGEFKGLQLMPWVATGFIKYSRSAFEKMKKAIDEGMFPECKPNPGQDWYGYFTPLKVGIGEDLSFGLRAEKIGVHSYLDASLVCLHADGNTLYGPKNTREKE